MTRELPEKYTPFEQVWVCNNEFNYGHVLFYVDNNPILLIGQGKKAGESIIWLRAPHKSPETKGPNKPDAWVDVISGNKVKNDNFKITNSNYGKEISFRDQPLVQFEVDSKKLIIKFIDFRPIGLNLFGGLSSLTIVGTVFSNNNFNNVHTMINIGG